VRPPGGSDREQPGELGVLEQLAERVADPDRQASLGERRPCDLRRACRTAWLDRGHIVIVDRLWALVRPATHRWPQQITKYTGS
jgi:hypothetical protein